MPYSINQAELLIQKLMSYYNVFTISELANTIGVSQPSISGWKRHNYVKAIANKCRELGIYNEIFGDLQKEEMELENSIFTEDTIKKLNIIKTMISDNQELENDFIELLKSFIKENL